METATRAESRTLLKRFLSQYFRAKDKQAALRKRLSSLQAELNSPGGAQPAQSGITCKIADIEDRIRKQIEIETKSVIAIMDVIEFLPADSIERDILEYRHIDCKSWDKIMGCVHLTRSPCFEYYNKALDRLLTYKKVQVTLSEFAARLDRDAKETF